MTTYLDSSFILERVFEPGASKETWREIDGIVTSTLAQVECLRAIDRIRVLGAMNELAQVQCREGLFRLLETSEVLELSRAVLDRAALPFPMAIQTLDAIHLSSALLYRESRGPLRFATNDRALARSAAAMGFEVIGAA